MPAGSKRSRRPDLLHVLQITRIEDIGRPPLVEHEGLSAEMIALHQDWPVRISALNTDRGGNGPSLTRHGHRIAAVAGLSRVIPEARPTIEQAGSESCGHA